RDGSRRPRRSVFANPERRMNWLCAALLFGACADPAPARTPRLLVSEAATGLAVGGGYAYYAASNAVRRVSLDGGDAQTIADGQLMRLDKASGAAEVLVAAQAGVGAVAVDAWNVYWYVSNSNGGPSRAVRRRALAGGAVVDLAADEAQVIAADGRFVWWGTIE